MKSDKQYKFKKENTHIRWVVSLWLMPTLKNYQGDVASQVKKLASIYWGDYG